MLQNFAKYPRLLQTVAKRLLPYAIHHLPYAIIHNQLPCAFCHMPHAIRYVSSVICHEPYVLYHISYVIYHMPSTLCHLPSDICHLPYSIFHLPFTMWYSCNVPSAKFHLRSTTEPLWLPTSYSISCTLISMPPTPLFPAPVVPPIIFWLRLNNKSVR